MINFNLLRRVPCALERIIRYERHVIDQLDKGVRVCRLSELHLNFGYSTEADDGVSRMCKADSIQANGANDEVFQLNRKGHAVNGS